MNYTIFAVALVAALLLFGCTGSSNAPAQQQNNSVSPAGNNQPPAPPAGGNSLVGTKFSAWKYYSMAIPIAPANITPETQAALNVFTVQQTAQPDGSLLVVVTDNQDKSVSNFTVGAGQTLYFSDGFPGDDVGSESDSMLLDDHFVLVDANGNIVQALTTP